MDWMRGLAALWVVFFHLNEPIEYVPNVYTNFCKLGWIGVPVFFVISGWCMAGISQRKPGARSFLAARVLRIFPPYWASLIVVALVVAVLVLLNGVNDVTILPKSTGALLATISLATSPVTPVPGVNWVYWSLSFEIAFYLLVAIGLGINNSPEKLDLWILFLFAFSVVVPVFELGPVWNVFTFWAREFALFAIGWFGQRLVFREGIPAMPLIACAVGLLVVASSPTHGLLKAAVGVASVVALGIGDLVSRRPIPALQWLGERSYSVYLIHVPLGCYLLLKLRSPFVLDHLLLHVCFDVIVAAAVVVSSGFFFSWVEAPSHRLAKLIAQRI